MNTNKKDGTTSSTMLCGTQRKSVGRTKIGNANGSVTGWRAGKRKQALILAVVLMLGAFGVTGCGNSGGSGTVPWQQGARAGEQNNTEQTVTVQTTTEAVNGSEVAETATSVTTEAAKSVTPEITTGAEAATSVTPETSAASGTTSGSVPAVESGTASGTTTEAETTGGTEAEDNGYSLPEEYNPTGKPPIDENGFYLFPYFSMKDREDKEVSLLDYEGKTLVLNFWASWCPPCMAEMPEFETMNAEFEEAGGDVAILAVNLTDGVRETRDKANKYIDENNYTFKVVYNEADDRGISFASHVLGLQNIPVTMVINSEGYLVDLAMGQVNKESVLTMVASAQK